MSVMVHLKSLPCLTTNSHIKDMKLLLVACPNTPTLPNHAHPQDFNENKLIVQKKCYYVFIGCKDITWQKNGKIPSSTFVRISILKVGVFGQIGGRVWPGNQ